LFTAFSGTACFDLQIFAEAGTPALPSSSTRVEVFLALFVRGRKQNPVCIQGMAGTAQAPKAEEHTLCDCSLLLPLLKYIPFPGKTSCVELGDKLPNTEPLKVPLCPLVLTQWYKGALSL
jgi:hypothetical protein